MTQLGLLPDIVPVVGKAQTLVDAGSRPGLRVGTDDGLVRRSDRRVSSNPELVRDADGLTELQRRFVELLVSGDPETGEWLRPAQAWVKAGGSQEQPHASAARVLMLPTVAAALQRQGAALVWSKGMVGQMIEMARLVVEREVQRLQRGGEPSRVGHVYAGLIVSLAGLKAPEKVEHQHDVADDLKERLLAARGRVAARPVLDGHAEPLMQDQSAALSGLNSMSAGEANSCCADPAEADHGDACEEQTETDGRE